MAITIEQAMEPLRNALKPKGTAHLTVLRLNPGCAVNADLVQKAIDEIVRHHGIEVALGEEQSACMQLAKIVLMDSAYL